MPDEAQDGNSLDTVVDTASSSIDQLESLINEAEQQAACPVNDHPKPCTHTVDEANNQHQKCPTCLWWFCDVCASPLDPRYCKLCLKEFDAELVETPLIDTDGVQHEGRVLTPAPGATFFMPRFGTLAKTISEMSDSELEDYVKQYKELVRQAERALDFRRVVLGASQLESSQRKDIQRRRLQGDKTRYPVRTVTLDTKSGKQVTTTKSASAKDMTNMLQMLEALQKLKVKKT